MNELIARYLKLVEQYPDKEQARFSLGKAYYDADQMDLAKVQFELALARKPDWMVVQILIGKCELAQGNREAAKLAFARALQLAIDQHHEGPQAEMEQLLSELE